MKEELKELEELCDDLYKVNQLFCYTRRGIAECDHDILEDKLSQADFVSTVCNALESLIDMYSSNINKLWNIWNSMSEIEWKKENENK